MTTPSSTNPPGAQPPHARSDSGKIGEAPVRWYRDVEHRWVFGVCAGLSRHTRVPVEIVRLAFVIAGFFVWGILVYIALAIIMPRRIS